MRLFVYGTLLDARTLAARGGRHCCSVAAAQRHYPGAHEFRDVGANFDGGERSVVV